MTTRGLKRERAPNWRGGRFAAKSGKQTYIYVYAPEHPRANPLGYVLEHVLMVVATRHGRPLPTTAQIHHVNGDGTDNRGANLVVCQDDAYHKLLHQRQRALAACGHPDWRKCPLCKMYSPLGEMHVTPSGHTYHRACNISYLAARRAARRLKHGIISYAERGRRRRVRTLLNTHCSRRHEYTPANTAFDGNGVRRCRRCRAENEKHNRPLREQRLL
jgi:hypothetical protein